MNGTVTPAQLNGILTIAPANITAIPVFLKAMLTVHGAHGPTCTPVPTLHTLADITSSRILRHREAMFTVT